MGAERFANEYQVRLLNNMAIFITLAVSYNLVNGVCGQLHLGPNAFITLGAYTAALLTLPPQEKELIFIITPLIWPLDQIVADTQFYVRDSVIDYITAMGTISPAIEGRLVFNP